MIQLGFHNGSILCNCSSKITIYGSISENIVIRNNIMSVHYFFNIQLLTVNNEEHIYNPRLI